MKLNKIMLVAVIASTMSAGVFAEDANQGSGTINFKGSIIDAPCSIAPSTGTNGAYQDVDLGQVANSVLNANSKAGKSTPADFSIQLENCDVSDTTKDAVKVTFTGTESDATTDGLLAIAGTAKGASIGIASDTGVLIPLGTASDLHTLLAGSNTLNFQAYLQGNGGSAVIVPGEFTSVANFTLAYE